MQDSHTGSLTGAIELEPQAGNLPISSKDQRLNVATNATTLQDAHALPRSETEPGLETLSVESQQQTPAMVVHALEKWNEPSVNINRLFATFWSFVIMGANDAAYGVSSIFKICI
jgi:hypothetical protein